MSQCDMRCSLALNRLGDQDRQEGLMQQQSKMRVKGENSVHTEAGCRKCSATSSDHCRSPKDYTRNRCALATKKGATYRSLRSMRKRAIWL
jgi:hypothetical protein